MYRTARLPSERLCHSVPPGPTALAQFARFCASEVLGTWPVKIATGSSWEPLEASAAAAVCTVPAEVPMSKPTRTTLGCRSTALTIPASQAAAGPDTMPTVKPAGAATGDAGAGAGAGAATGVFAGVCLRCLRCLRFLECLRFFFECLRLCLCLWWRLPWLVPVWTEVAAEAMVEPANASSRRAAMSAARGRWRYIEGAASLAHRPFRARRREGLDRVWRGRPQPGLVGSGAVRSRVLLRQISAATSGGVAREHGHEAVHVRGRPCVRVALNASAQTGVGQRRRRRAVVGLRPPRRDGGPRTLERAVHRAGRRVERLGHLAGGEVERLAEDQHRSLPRR